MTLYTIILQQIILHYIIVYNSTIIVPSNTVASQMMQPIPPSFDKASWAFVGVIAGDSLCSSVASAYGRNFSRVQTLSSREAAPKNK